jgi:hypothetical protein
MQERSIYICQLSLLANKLNIQHPVSLSRFAQFLLRGDVNKCRLRVKCARTVTVFYSKYTKQVGSAGKLVTSIWEVLISIVDQDMDCIQVTEVSCGFP